MNDIYKNRSQNVLVRVILSLLLTGLCVWAVADFSEVASTAGRFSLRWRIGLGGFALFCLVLLSVCLAALWISGGGLYRALAWRKRLEGINLVLALLAAICAVWLFQYSFWGSLLLAPSIHLVVYLAAAVWAAFWFERNGEALFGVPAALAGLLVAGCSFSLGRAFIGVRDYPFPVYWSEGNRLWDYSILFGGWRYNNPGGAPIPVSIDIGRQILWGVPFLIPGLPIWGARLWSALVSTLPYALLGWAAFSPGKGRRSLWLAGGLWTYLFLAQAAIYTPLIVSAILIASAWRAPFRRAVLLTALGGLFAYASRTTWMFAPLLWIVMLEVVLPRRQDSFAGDGRAMLGVPVRALELGGVGLLAGIAAPAAYGILLKAFFPGVPSLLGMSAAAALILGAAGLAYWVWQRWNPQGGLRAGILTSGAVAALGAGAALFYLIFIRHAAAASEQPLLWSRLLPNTTYAPGILGAVALAVLPLLALLIVFAVRRRASWKALPAALILLPLLAFLGVGLVASVKIGGGSNLHNLDMFFVDLVFLAALAWEASGSGLPEGWMRTRGMQVLLALLVVLPALQAVLDMAPLVLVSSAEAQKALRRVQAEVEAADARGPILFMDHRQLLTFAYVKNVPLIPEYEKKIVMDYAMAGDEAYFEKFYADLEARRFALIISDPLKISYAEKRLEDTGFGEENDAWVTWVAEPVLRYYEPLDQFKGIGLQLLAPRPLNAPQ